MFPSDRVVEECLLLEIQKMLGYMGTLKWLKYYLMERKAEPARLARIREDLLKKPPTDRNYALMRQLLLN